MGFDRDGENLDRAREYLSSIHPEVTKHYVHSSFSHLKEKLETLSISTIDTILYDL